MYPAGEGSWWLPQDSEFGECEDRSLLRTQNIWLQKKMIYSCWLLKNVFLLTPFILFVYLLWECITCVRNLVMSIGQCIFVFFFYSVNSALSFLFFFLVIGILVCCVFYGTFQTLNSLYEPIKMIPMSSLQNEAM